jgi:hypothetical protein
VSEEVLGAAAYLSAPDVNGKPALIGAGLILFLSQ